MRGIHAHGVDPAPEAERQFGLELAKQSTLLRRYAHQLTKGGADADDLLQDTMLRCWAARHRFELGTNLAAWARTVMRNSFLSDRRRDRFRAELSDTAFDLLLSVPANQESVVALKDLKWALDELLPEQRAAVLLAGEGTSIAESAVQLSVAEGTIKSRIYRGRERLRQLTDDRSTLLLVDKRKRTPTTLKGGRRDWSEVVIG